MSFVRCIASTIAVGGNARIVRCVRRKGHDGPHGDGPIQWTERAAGVRAVDAGRATERADLLAWLDGDLPVDLDPYTVMRVREVVRAGEHVGAAKP